MKRLFLCLLVFVFVACDKTLGPPEGVLSEKKMVAVLVDLQVAEAKVKNLRVSSDSARHIFSIYEVIIFDEHNVTAEEYLHSYQYYLENHKLMNRVHDGLLDTLQQRQKKVELLPDTAAAEEENSAPVSDFLLRDSVINRSKRPMLDSARKGSQKYVPIKKRKAIKILKQDKI